MGFNSAFEGLIHRHYYPPIYAYVFHVVNILQVSPQEPYLYLFSPVRAIRLAHLILYFVVLIFQYTSYSS